MASYDDGMLAYGIKHREVRMKVIKRWKRRGELGNLDVSDGLGGARVRRRWMKKRARRDLDTGRSEPVDPAHGGG